MYGLTMNTASTASILLNQEAVFTALLAWLSMTSIISIPTLQAGTGASCTRTGTHTRR
jgi:drug/metabolite transporter (DMT)-like permease